MDAPSPPEHDLSRPPDGQIASWAQVMVLLASLATLAIVLLVPDLILDVDSSALRSNPWIRFGLAGLLALALVLAWSARIRTSVFARIAIVLPLAHLVVMLAVALGWCALSQHLTSARDLVPIVDAIPLGVVVGIFSLTILLAACVIARRRRREVVHVAVMIALLGLLLLGVWLPIASEVAGPSFGVTRGWVEAKHLFAAPIKLATFALAPPLVVTIAYTAIATRRRRWIDAARPTLVALLTFALILACCFRAKAHESALMIYLNFVPWLLAAAFVAVSAIAALCASYLIDAARHRRAIARDRRDATAVVRGEDETIGRVVIVSWLRGPEIVVHGFTLETSDGTMPVPPGVTLAAPLPPSTTILRVGEGIAVLQHGATVGVSGLDRASGGAPFRSSLAPTAGDRPIVVGREHDGTSGLDQVVLAAWRPCVAYLVIFTLAALPALSALRAISNQF